ncbi:alkaline phosphatase family protein [Antarcticibacterium arcticum]|uniref:Alkaline phosphatase family protein n=1 Tax=Antarcticibacterium arcticum TaxID=2585771 RepID=A0A5B8YNG5_9FLAO|nr:alkaline phosphatase PafA [Antarcticibacterium arcticum]QED38828.1 alkaline phosphatase family protein [Antarcticibacterium arcticum]
MKNLPVFLILIFSYFNFQAQNVELTAQTSEKPKLVVGIVVDQMRYDYITRFWEKYEDNGFKRIISEGFNFKNTHFNYVPTYTAPGHASVFTGTTPQNHGIIGNGWYNKFEKKEVYNAGDDSVESVGTTSEAGKMSPHRMLSTTVADENRLFTQMRGKTIGIGLKDRGAILPAGHTANAAYWFQGRDEGKWISSTYYMKDLPKWVKDFNKSGQATSYIKTWNTLHDIETYIESGPDKNTFEGGYNGQTTFPYDLAALAGPSGKFELVKVSPYGNSLTTDFAIAAINAEELGQDNITDILTLSYSSPDYIGHNFGVNSKEIQDTYLRLDIELARLLQHLDEKVGIGNYTIFLTSDHGGGDVPSYMKSVKIPSGYFDESGFNEKIQAHVREIFDEEGLIERIYGYNVFFNYDALREADINAQELENTIAHYILQYPQVSNVFTRTQLESGSFTTGTAALVQNGFNQKRSGDVIMVLKPSVISYSETGSTHGSGFSYDTHAPLLFFGKGIPRGSSYERAEIIDIAPTISALLGISNPNAATGKPLRAILESKSSKN